MATDKEFGEFAAKARRSIVRLRRDLHQHQEQDDRRFAELTRAISDLAAEVNQQTRAVNELQIQSAGNKPWWIILGLVGRFGLIAALGWLAYRLGFGPFT